MKYNKSTIFILLFLCIVIWATISWKVFYNLRDSPVPVTQVPKLTKVVNDDSVRLLLDYRDPFLGDYLIEDNSKVGMQEEDAFESPEYSMAFEQEILPDFQYKGSIRIGKVSQAIVSRQDEIILLNAGNKIGEFTVLNIAEEALTVSRKGKKYQLNIE